MREMKDSGIEWVGNVPITWEVKPIRADFCEITEKNRLGEVKNALKFTYGRIVPKDNFDADDDNYVADTILNYTIVTPGTIMLNCLNLNFDFVSQRIGLVTEKGIITSAYMAFEAKNNNVFPQYATYLFKSYDNCKAFHNMGGGVRKILNFNEFKKKYYLLPPKNEQIAIVNYLDTKCAEIDALVSDIQQQIDTLEQDKRSIITEAVTKGLDRDVKMKDSGVEWIGDIPEHWIVHPLYFYFGERKNKNALGLETNLLSLSYGRIIRKDIHTNGGLLPESFNTYNIIEKNDIVIRPTDLQNDKRSLRTGISKEHGIITSAYIAMKAIKPINPDYFHYLLHAYDVMKVFYNMGNGVRQGLNFSEFSRLMVFEPPIEEQDKIVDYLNKNRSEIDTIISEKQKKIETIEEYKKSLIFEYVTGKKEVADTTATIILHPVILLAMILREFGNDLKGKIHAQKAAYLCEMMLQTRPNAQYYRFQQGPYDEELDSYLMQINKMQWFTIYNGNPMTCCRGKKYNEFEEKYKELIANYSPKIKIIVDFIRNMKSSQAGRVATLYAVWNDMIIDGISAPTDNQIIDEVTTNWTPNKKNSSKLTWQDTLDKMKTAGIVPTGFGLRTKPKE